MKSLVPWVLLALFATPSSTTLSVESRLVFVDVIARDATGHPVAGLEATDFSLQEGGKTQPIVFFEEHHSVQKAPSGPPPGLAPGAVTNVANGVTDADLNMLLFDLADTPLLDQPYARQQMIRFLQNLAPGHQIALFVLSDRLYFLQGFTGDSGTLAAAAKRIDVREMHLTTSVAQQDREAEDIAQLELGLRGGPSSDFLGMAVQQAIAGKEVNDARIRTALVADAFRTIARSVSGYNGRKNLLWLSETFPFGLADHLQILRADATGVPLLASAHDVSEGAVKTLMDSQIAVYPINVVGVETDSVGADLSGLGTAPHMQNLFERRQFTRESMNVIADATGGRAIYGTNDLSGALARVIDETTTRYTLAYRPADLRFDGGLRRIRVSAKIPGLSLTYRHSYLATRAPSVQTVQPQALVGAMRPGLPPATGLRMTATPELAGGASATVTVTGSINVRDISLTEDSAGHRHGALQVLLAAIPQSKTGADRPPQAPALMNLNLDAGQYAAMLTNGVQFRQSLAVPSGTWSLRLGVIDLTSGQMGTLAMPITVP